MHTKERPYQLGSRLFAEFLGTMLFVFIGEFLWVINFKGNFLMENFKWIFFVKIKLPYFFLFYVLGSMSGNKVVPGLGKNTCVLRWKKVCAIFSTQNAHYFRRCSCRFRSRINNFRLGYVVRSCQVRFFSNLNFSIFSGGHFNPAVSWAVGLAGRMPLYEVPAYWVVQLLGGFFGSLLVRVSFLWDFKNGEFLRPLKKLIMLVFRKTSI